VIELLREVLPELEGTVWLRGGRALLVRPLRRSDAPLLIELHERLSEHSRYLRFLGAKPHLSLQEAEGLADVDFRERFAISAISRDEGRDEIVAVARFQIVGEGRAEAAVVVRDDFQGAGLGTKLLLRLLALARWAGVREFGGEVLAANTRMLRLLKLGGAHIGKPRHGAVEVVVPVRSPSLVFRILRSFANEAARLATRGRSAG